MTDQPDDPYASPPSGWQAPPQPPPYGAPPQPYGAPPQYGAAYGQYAPGYQPSGYPPPTTTNGYAIAALACSIVLAVFAGIGSILGVVFGIIGLRHCRQHNERGRGLAIAGIVIGAIGILFWLLALIGLLAESNSSDNSTTNVGTIGVHVSTR